MTTARRFPSLAFTISASASSSRELDPATIWEQRLESLGLGKSNHGDLPGFHFERPEDGTVSEGTRLHAMWASGGGGIEAVVRKWSPDQRSFDLDIVNTDDGFTWRTYEWKVEPLSAGSSRESVRVRFYTPFRLVALLKCIVLVPLRGTIARSALEGRY